MSKRLAYLGPAGTYSEQAALNYEPTADLLPFSSIPAVAAAVDSGLADECIVPIENSLEGSVTFTLDLLIHDSKLFIRNELVIPIEHCLIVKPGTKFEDIKAVFSHPQSLGQCRSFLERCFPTASQVASLSNSTAVEEMQRSEITAAAIASHRAATLYGAEILAQGIADNSNNHTRFVILASADHAPTGMDKTSLCFSFDEDAPGIVHSVLADIAKRHINLTKIESRPTRQTLGRYIFLLDIEGHRLDTNVSEALDAVKAQVSMFKIFGSYPMQVSSSV